MGEVEMKMAIIVFGVVIVLVAAVRLVTYNAPLQQEMMNSSDMMVLLLCQTEKVYKDLGVVEGKRYLMGEVSSKAIRESETVQEILWDEGYTCDTPVQPG
jgi:hypothetical protein